MSRATVDEAGLRLLAGRRGGGPAPSDAVPPDLMAAILDARAWEAGKSAAAEDAVAEGRRAGHPAAPRRECEGCGDG